MNKTYLIVGERTGIGKQIATQLSQKDHRVIGLSSSMDELAKWDHYQVDVTDDTPNFPKVEGELDGIIYCPGSIQLKPFRSLKPKLFKAEWELNFLGAVKTIQFYLKQLNHSSSIVLFSTVAVQKGMPFHTSIAAAKGAIEGFGRSLAAELSPKVRVNVIAPSLTNTPLASKLLSSEIKREASANRHPLKRIGEADDIANAACFLLSKEASWITGQILAVDGGLSTLSV